MRLNAFLPVHNIITWTYTKDETLHTEINWNFVNDDDMKSTSRLRDSSRLVL
ncbi:hypothetical protein PILCRDRAFT_820128 [Piloderma croceum F 1598]|uniref:Uncharacterized protein n=1 Tax=Piloderma croceum (strain F 1598) TaxID=765440 RepID=A0A0C3FT03_PILCF|nr:hypothetical protein PILCRDRAFT_820128 [Piloderma croceum F 1598]